MVQTFAAHFSAVDGAHKISGLDDLDSTIAKPYGGLALASSAVSHNIQLTVHPLFNMICQLG
jgi:hypothetical protein